MSSNWDTIPVEMKRMQHWVCWRMGTRGKAGKPTKQPYNARTGKMAKSDDPSTWCTFDEAISGMERYNMAGIGFMFSGSGLVGIDVDHCRDTETGEMTAEIRHIIETLDSYTEYSQSGAGLHIICRGRLPEGRRRKGPFEMYDTGRYFVMTGRLLDDAHGTIEDRQEQIEQVHREYVAEEKKPAERRARSARTADQVSLDDAELIRKAMAAKNGQVFARLWSGDITGHASHSEADLALCNLLAFWTGRDIDRMINLWRQSGMWRDKCDEMHGGRTYAAITAVKAAADTANVYTPQEDRPRRREVQPPPGMSWENDAQTIPPIPQEPVTEPSQEYRGEQLQTIPSAPSLPAASNLLLSTHDMGRAHRFAESVKGWLLWCEDYEAWMIWTGRTWQRDRTLQVVTWCKGVVEQMVEEAIQNHVAVRSRDSEDLLKKISAARANRSITSMINLAKDELAVTADAFDQDPYLLNCQTGVIDLRTGHLMPHHPRHMMTKMADAGYSGDCQESSFTMFGDFLKTITCNDPALAEYFQTVCGMAAIGKVLNECLCMFHGTGRNGKSTFLNCISRIFGDYAGPINPEALMMQRDGRQQSGGLSVYKKRLVVAQETEEGKRLSSQALKKMSSTDPITERPLYENERTFIPSHTLILSTNFLPRVSSTDDGTWRRLVVVPFRAAIPEKEQIKDYVDRLIQADSDAILGWIVAGAVRYIAAGCRLDPPQCVVDMTNLYKNAEDWLGNFLAECCNVGRFSTPAADLYDAYEAWCAEANEHPRRARDFAAALEARGFTKRKTMTCNMWDGVEVNINHRIDKITTLPYNG